MTNANKITKHKMSSAYSNDYTTRHASNNLLEIKLLKIESKCLSKET